MNSLKNLITNNMSNNKQSSVEKMFQEMLGIQQEGIKLTFDENLALLEKYKAMHNDEITRSMNVAFIDALKIRDENYKSPYEDWEQYYNETFGDNDDN
jgi:hypothetical protein